MGKKSKKSKNCERMRRDSVGATHFSCRLLASFGSSRVWTRCTMHFILRAQAIVQLTEAGYGRGSAPGDE